MKIYDLKSNQIQELEQYNQKSLHFLYQHPIGRICLKVITQPIISKIYGFYNNSKLSTHKISKFIDTYHISMSDYQTQQYYSFNEFFARKIQKKARTISNNSADFISCCDSKLMLYPIEENLIIPIKNSFYSVGELIQNQNLAMEYKGGTCAVFRLTVDDYHRYSFFDDGTISFHKKIKGVLHTVSPIAYENYQVFAENSREVSVLDTKNFGSITQIEVGALMVGKIVNHDISKFSRGQEKGYFEFGGSTIILLIPKNSVVFNKKIWKYSKEGIETKVQLGTVLGKAQK